MRNDLKDKIITVMNDVNNYVEGKQEMIYYFFVSLLTKTNLFILGDFGQSKSMVLDLVRERITGTKQFKYQMHKQADSSELFGRLDLNSMIPGNVTDNKLSKYPKALNLKAEIDRLLKQYETTGDIKILQKIDEITTQFETLKKAISALEGNKPEINTSGKIPDVDIVNVEETFNGSGSTLQSMQTAMQEHEVRAVSVQ